MADKITREMRSLNMSAIKNRDTKPELWFRKQLFTRGYRYRKNTGTIVGHPDIWLAKYRTAVFVHGCYWHRHKGCKYAYIPKSNLDFWNAKFQKNIERDESVKEKLRSQGIRVIIVWECSIKTAMKSAEKTESLLNRFCELIMSDELFVEL